MAHRWVIRVDAYTKKRADIAHLVQGSSVLHGLPALCGESLKTSEFWERAERKTVVCSLCKGELARKR